MKNRGILLLLLTLCVACTTKVPLADTVQLNGYWEIEKVILASGEEKTFGINQTVDFFELKDGKGFRRKVMPGFDGKYTFASGPEQVRVIETDSATLLEYTTEFRKWTETLKSISAGSFAVENEAGIEYRYKRYEPFSLK